MLYSLKTVITKSLDVIICENGCHKKPRWTQLLYCKCQGVIFIFGEMVVKKVVITATRVEQGYYNSWYFRGAGEPSMGGEELQPAAIL